MIAHVVLFEPKATIAEADRENFLDAMRTAFKEIPTVTRSMVGKRKLIGAGYEAKLGESAYSYVSVVEFEGVHELKAYLDHPLHERLGQLFWEYCDRTTIVDAESFWLNTKEIGNRRP